MLDLTKEDSLKAIVLDIARDVAREKLDAACSWLFITTAYHYARLEMRHPMVRELVGGIQGGYAWGMAFSGLISPTECYRNQKKRAGDALASLGCRLLFSNCKGTRRECSEFPLPRQSTPAWDEACKRSADKARSLGLVDQANDIEG